MGFCPEPPCQPASAAMGFPEPQSWASIMSISYSGALALTTICKKMPFQELAWSHGNPWLWTLTLNYTLPLQTPNSKTPTPVFYLSSVILRTNPGMDPAQFQDVRHEVFINTCTADHSMTPSQSQAENARPQSLSPNPLPAPAP